MQIAIRHGSADTRAADPRNGAVHWFETVARIVLIAAVVLIGAALVRNVTDVLSAAAGHTVAQDDAGLALVSR